MAAPGLMEGLAQLETLARTGAGLQPSDELALLADLAGEIPLSEDRPPQAIELQGWLELLWEDAPHLVIAGFNDGLVPESIVGDPYLPENLRSLRALRLKTNDERFVRDLYLLRALLEPRRSGGRVDFLIPKTSSTGDPLRPSRLLFRCRDEELPARVAHLFREPETPGLQASWSPGFVLRPEPERAGAPAQPIARIAVTSFATYLASPFHFWAERLQRFSEIDPGKAEMDDLDFGNFCHAVLQRFGNDPEARTWTDASRISDFLLDSADTLARSWFGPRPGLAVRIQVDAARRRLAEAARHEAAGRAEGWEITAVEAPLAEICPLHLGGIEVSGKIDRLERNGNRIRILDFKTSDTAIPPRRDHFVEHRASELPAWPPAYAFFDHAGFGKKPRIQSGVTGSRSFSYLFTLWPQRQPTRRPRSTAATSSSAKPRPRRDRIAGSSSPASWKPRGGAPRGSSPTSWPDSSAASIPPSGTTRSPRCIWVCRKRPWTSPDSRPEPRLRRRHEHSLSLFPAGEPNLLIEASAGSGKTHHLVGRILRLLLAFRRPDQIVALTFTRKAAGEFFDRILGALAEAAASPHGAQKAARDYQVEGLTQPVALDLLRLAADSLHRLSLGTLDSFYARILRTFPGEFGIGGSFQVLEEPAAAAARREVFDLVLSDVDQADDFLRAFRQATFGSAEKRLLPNLESFVETFHRLLLACPDRDGWSRPSAIWPQPPWWLTATFDLGDLTARLREALPSVEAQHKSAAQGLEKLIVQLPAFSEGSTGCDISTLVERVLAALDGLHHGETSSIEFYKKGGLQLVPPLRRALADAGGFILQREIVAKLQQTAGIYDIIRRYESLHHSRIRRSGRLGFDDVLVLLAGAAPDAAGAGGQPHCPELTMLDDRPDDATRRLRVDYRLDSQFHHWLIDEFQDTSRLQWQVLQRLIDEVIADDSGRRSFYYVGDEKQAIYGWRGGDSRLFQEVKHRYDIREEHLDVSWRSGPVLLEAVNQIFGNGDGLEACLGEDHAPLVLARWADANAGRHQPSPRTRVQPGWFQLITVPKPEGAASESSGDAEDGEESWDGENPCWRVVLEILQTLDPVRNRLSVAVLMRRTRSGGRPRRFPPAIRRCPGPARGSAPHRRRSPRRHRIPRLAAMECPSWRHRRLGPLSDDARPPRPGPREPGARADRTAAAGSRNPARPRLRSRLPVVDRPAPRRERAGLGSFSTHRIAQLAEACRRFDLQGSRSVRQFLAYLDGCAAADPPSAGVVQIMTIHKAKGLTFDAVVLADLKSGPVTGLRKLDAVRGYDDQPAPALARWTARARRSPSRSNPSAPPTWKPRPTAPWRNSATSTSPSPGPGMPTTWSSPPRAKVKAPPHPASSSSGSWRPPAAHPAKLSSAACP